MTTPHAAYSVDELNALLATFIGDLTPEPVTVAGTLTAWNRSKAWQRGELVTLTNNKVTAKLTIGCTARHGVGITRSIAETGRTLVPPVECAMTGQLTFHEQYGLRFNVHRIHPDSIDTADTQKQRDALIEDLKATGHFYRQPHMEPPSSIDVIGLITPSSGEAGRQDALAILQPLAKEIHEHRVATANADAHANIAKAIAALEHRSDIIVIVRGGGATSDLHVWDHETVAHAIARCNTPIVVGVGHATDNHIARQIAWHGANTPTAAAQHVAQLISPSATASLPAAPSAKPLAPTETAILVHPQMLTAAERRRRRLVSLATVIALLAALAFAYWVGLQR